MQLAAQEAEAQERYEVAMLSAMGSLPGAGSGKKDYKGRYYFEKFGITPRDEEVHKRLRTYYLEVSSWDVSRQRNGPAKLSGCSRIVAGLVGLARSSPPQYLGGS